MNDASFSDNGGNVFGVGDVKSGIIDYDICRCGSLSGKAADFVGLTLFDGDV
jgi:hypothetical protein